MILGKKCRVVNETCDRKFYYLPNGVLLKVESQPDGTIWYNDRGQFHKEDGPAIIHPFGECHYYLYGKRYTPVEYRRAVKSLKEKRAELNGTSI